MKTLPHAPRSPLTASRPLRSVQADAVQARLGARLAGALSLQSERLPHDIHERLRFAREQALQRARRARAPAATGSALPMALPVLVWAGGPARGPRQPTWWLRSAALLPIVVLVAGLIAIDRHRDQERVAVAAAIDAELLADDLPPVAWSDPGFAEFLRSAPP